MSYQIHHLTNRFYGDLYYCVGESGVTACYSTEHEAEEAYRQLWLSWSS